MSEMCEYDTNLFMASTLQRLFTLGMVVNKTQYGPSPIHSVVNNKSYRELFDKMHGTWLADQEGFARELVRTGIISEGAFRAMKFNPKQREEADIGKEWQKSRKQPKKDNEKEKEKEKEKKENKKEKEVLDTKEKEEEKEKEKPLPEESEDSEEKSEESTEERVIVKPSKSTRKQREEADKEKESRKPRRRRKEIEKVEVQCLDVNCGKVYTNYANMKQHYRTAHKEKTYACPFKGCEKSFTRKNDLTRHYENKHLGKQHRFTCGQCPETFVSSFNLTRHLSVMH